MTKGRKIYVINFARIKLEQLKYLEGLVTALFKQRCCFNNSEIFVFMPLKHKNRINAIMLHTSNITRILIRLTVKSALDNN